MSYDPPIDLNFSAAGDVKVSQQQPLLQISATYGVRTQQVSTTVVGADASISVTDNKFRVESGTDAAAIASLLSARIARYRAGQGLTARFTALFSAGTANSLQMAGFITSENGVGFGRLNGEFGIIHYYGGEPESQVLTLTGADAGAQDVTIDGVVYPVNLTGATAVENAFQIANQLDVSVPSYDITSNGSTVVFQGVIPEVAGLFDYSGQGAFEQVTAGADVTLNFTPQSAWNRDTAAWLSPSLGNVYSVQYQYLGFGNINFYVADPKSGLPVLVHAIEWLNSGIETNTSNPNMRIGWLARNTGSTTNVWVEGGSAAVFLEGIRKLDGYQSSASNDQVGVGTVGYTSIVALRNRVSFGGRQNRIEAFPTFLSLVTNTNKAGFFRVLIDPEFIGELEWQYVDEDNSIIEYATGAALVTGGRSIGSVVLPPNQPATIILNSSDGNDLPIQPGSTLVIAGQSSQNDGDFQASITIEQDD